MASDILIQDASVVSEHRVTAVDKINAVKQVQDLPHEGKNLPSETKQKDTEIENIEQAAQSMNEHAQLVQRQLQFSIDKDSGRTVITVLDSETQEVIRQIPGEEALQLARKLEQGGEIELLDQFV